MKTLILYSSRDGQTKKITEFMAIKLQHKTECYDLNQLDFSQLNLNEYDQVIIGASIRYGHFQSCLAKFAHRFANELNQKKTGFFSVNLIARKAEKNTPETNSYTKKFLRKTPWKPSKSAVFAGALYYPRYNWFARNVIRLIMKMTGGETDIKKEVEYTHWHEVEIFVQQFN